MLQDGPRVETRPAVSREVCTGCKYLHKSAHMRGHFKCTDNYNCIHPEAGDRPGAVITVLGPGRSIAFNAEETPDTPEWCPFKKKKV